MISVIGAGTAGLYSAYLLSKKGYDVKVFDQKKKIGEPVQCTGIVTSKINEIISLKKEVIQNKIKRIEVNSEKDPACIKLRDPDIVLDRKEFDQYLGDIAKKEGVEVNLERKFTGIEKGEVILKSNKGTEKKKSEYVIGADGPLSSIYNIVNPGLKKRFYKGIQARVKGEFEKDMFKVYLGKVCPDFFAWIVPEDESTARVGLASMGNQKELFDRFIGKLGIKEKRIIEMQGGLIPVYNPRVKTRKENIYLVGDAATQLKASTGGGIVQGMMAAEALCDSISNGKDYEKEWRKRIGKDLWLHLKIREYLNKFRDRDYDRLVGMLRKDRLRNILEKESRDNPSKFIAAMISAEPRLLSFALKVF